MRLRSSIVLLVAGLGTASAYADDTRMRVMEVQLASATSAESQFVELVDPGESFSESYSFVVYDATGTSIAGQALPLSAGTTRVVLASSAAQDEYHLHPGTTGTVSIVNLQSTLPAAGAVCFRRQDGGERGGAAADSSGTRIHCLGWGNASSFPVSIGGTQHGAAPPAGTSLQVLAGCLQVDPPTPHAPSTQACEVRNDHPIEPVDAAVPEDAPPPPVDAAIDAAPAPTPSPEKPTRSAESAGSATEAAPAPPKKSKGCAVGGDPGSLGLAGLAVLALRRRRRPR